MLWENLICLVFENAVKQIDVKLTTIDDIKNTVAQLSGLDVAESLCQKLIEDCVGDVVSAFQKYAEQTIKEKVHKLKLLLMIFKVLTKEIVILKKYWALAMKVVI